MKRDFLINLAEKYKQDFEKLFNWLFKEDMQLKEIKHLPIKSLLKNYANCSK
jgi:hypothetical protein